MTQPSQSGQPPQRRRRAARWLVIATALAAVALPVSASAEPAGTQAGTPVKPTAPSQSPVTVHSTITLVTGDTVQYTETADGRASATIVSSPNPREVYHTYGDPTGFYVIPTSAMSLVVQGLVDRELFDVKYLAHHGYGDDRQATLPVIVSYAPTTAARQARELPGSTKQRDLHSVSGEARTVDKRQARAFWSTVTSAGGGAAGPAAQTLNADTLASGVQRLWLDQRVKVNLADSVPLVGAPQAWAAGYDGTGVKVAVLDTGIDANHPDLRGKVVASQSFVPGVTNANDGHGHGTHVASIVAGTGAGSDGRYRGVAPGAQLIVGKVLTDTGSGDLSWLIDAMEWAVANGARVVNLSLGGPPTDGTDPASTAVNRLTAETGALFVVAAGNAGPGQGTVGTPAAADAALTVAATAKDDTTAGFSSRGPRHGDRALKPDIAAPGVGIVAARAAGSQMPEPVNDLYTRANGTSMATPHVAGAAAILAQQHPDWTAARLKATLMSTAEDTGASAYEVGAGRLDVARAVRQRVFATTPNADFGVLSPGPESRAARQVGYVNETDQPVTLRLTATLRDSNGGAVPAGTISVAETVTVPAGGSATVTVTADANGLELGQYTGSLVATDEATGTRLTVPMALVRQPPMRKVDVRIVGRPDEPLAYGNKGCSFLKLDDSQGSEVYHVLLSRHADGPNVSEGSGWVPDGRYDVQCDDLWSEKGAILASGRIVDPEMEITGDVQLTWDLSTVMVPIEDTVTPRPSEIVQMSAGYVRTTASGQSYFSATLTANAYGQRYYVTPTSKPTSIGTYKSFVHHTLAAPEAAATVQGRGTVQVRPVYPHDAEIYPKFATDQRLRLSTIEDVRAGRDVRGTLVIVPSQAYVDVRPDVQAAAEAGAAGVLTYVAGRSKYGYWGSMPILAPETVPIPVLWLDGRQWAEVAKVLAGADRPTIHIRSQLTSPYEYKLRFYEYGKIPTKIAYRVHEKDLAQRDTEYHAQVPASSGQPNMYEAVSTYGVGDFFSVSTAHWFTAPTARVEFYTVTGPDVLWLREYTVIDPKQPDAERYIQSWRGFSTASREREVFNQGPVTLGMMRVGPEWNPDRWAGVCTVCRFDDTIYFYPQGVPAHDSEKWVWSVDSTVEYSLERDGVPIPEAGGGWLPQFRVPSGEGRYTLRTVYHDNFSGQRPGTTVSTDWTFTSAGGGPDNVRDPYVCAHEATGDQGPCTWQPLILLEYGLDLALDDTAPAGRAYSFTVTPRHQQPSGAPAIVGLRVQVSYNDGAQWTNAVVKPERDGSYRVRIKHPRLEKTTGAVSIRAEAWDAAGNRVVQRIDRAYALSGSPHGGPRAV